LKYIPKFQLVYFLLLFGVTPDSPFLQLAHGSQINLTTLKIQLNVVNI